jgi:hypothetical protein
MRPQLRNVTSRIAHCMLLSHAIRQTPPTQTEPALQPFAGGVQNGRGRVSVTQIPSSVQYVSGPGHGRPPLQTAKHPPFTHRLPVPHSASRTHVMLRGAGAQ